MLLTINPKNDKIVRYLFKHNLNICKDENIFEVFREYFKKSKHVIISTPYIKKTNMFDSNLSLITVKSLSDFLSTPGNNISIKCLQKKKIDIIFFDGGFVNICKDYAKANFKNNSKLLNSRILKKFRFIMPNGNDLSKKSYFAHSKFYLFDNKHLLIVSANFSENGLKDKSNSGRHTEYDFGVDILLSNTNFKNTVKSTIDNFSFIIDSKNIAAINKTKWNENSEIFKKNLASNINVIYEKESFSCNENENRLHAFLNKVDQKKPSFVSGKSSISFVNKKKYFICLGILASGKHSSITIERKNGKSHKQKQYRIKIKNTELFKEFVKWNVSNGNRVNSKLFIENLIYNHNFERKIRTKTVERVTGKNDSVKNTVPKKYKLDFQIGYEM